MHQPVTPKAFPVGTSRTVWVHVTGVKLPCQGAVERRPSIRRLSRPDSRSTRAAGAEQWSRTLAGQARPKSIVENGAQLTAKLANLRSSSRPLTHRSPGWRARRHRPFFATPVQRHRRRDARVSVLNVSAGGAEAPSRCPAVWLDASLVMWWAAWALASRREMPTRPGRLER